MNQDANAKEVQKFFADLGIDYAYNRVNNARKKDLDTTRMPGSSPIDTIAASEGIMEHIEGSKLLPYHEIVSSDHRACVIDANFKDYFSTNLS